MVKRACKEEVNCYSHKGFGTYYDGGVSDGMWSHTVHIMESRVATLGSTIADGGGSPS